MSTKDKPSIHPELLKIYNSPTYRKKVKKVIESIKNLRGFKHGEKLRGRPNKLPANATDKERERYAKVCAGRPDREMAHYFAQTSEHNYERKISKDAENKASEQA